MGAAEFVKSHAPPGMVATLTGLQGGAHNGLGKVGLQPLTQIPEISDIFKISENHEISEIPEILKSMRSSSYSRFQGFGGLLGGFTIEYTKSTHRAFWNFGLVAFICGSVYSLYVLVMMLVRRRKGGVRSQGVGAPSQPSAEGLLVRECHPHHLSPPQMILKWPRWTRG